MSTLSALERLRKANPFPAERIENDILFDEIVRGPGDPRTAHRRRPGSRESRGALLIAMAALLAAAAPVGALVGWSVFAPTKGQLEAERGGIFLPESFRTLRSLELPAGVTWTVVTYKTTKYECVDVYGGTSGSPEPSGAVGGCGGLPPLSDDQVIQGGLGGSLTVGGTLYSVSGGRVTPEVAAVRATFADGSTAVDHPVGGVWLFVGSADRPPTLVAALDEQGEVLSRLRLSAALQPPPD